MTTVGEWFGDAASFSATTVGVPADVQPSQFSTATFLRVGFESGTRASTVRGVKAIFFEFQRKLRNDSQLWQSRSQ